MDGAGDLYGTSGYLQFSETNKLSPNKNGTWTSSDIYNFNVSSGVSPQPQAQLIFDKNGNLYGTNFFGGDGINGTLCYGELLGCGTVYELSPSKSGWTETTLYYFTGLTSDGGNPAGGLVQDLAGNLYGTTFDQGTYGFGTVFELTHNTHGWTEKVLYNFTGGTEGGNPFTGVLLGKDGNLYGTTGSAIYELKRTAKGEWPIEILYSANNPGVVDLIFGPDGNLYGTCDHCGQSAGQIVRLAKNHGQWTLKILHNFGSGKDGSYPAGGLVFDAAGNFYGQTNVGGVANAGTLFRLVKNSTGKWQETTLFSFPKFNCGGSGATVILDKSAKNLYGVDACGNDFQFKF
jgi:uncharacterized repeat protein (TIGR03803 family)